MNKKNYISLPNGLDEKLKFNDEVKVKMLWRWAVDSQDRLNALYSP